MLIVGAILNGEWIARLQGQGAAPLPTTENATNQLVLSGQLEKFPNSMSSERPGDIEAGGSTLSLEIVRIVDRREQTVASQARCVDDTDRLAQIVSSLERERTAETVQDRKRSTIVMSPAAVIAVADSSEERIRTEASGKGSAWVWTSSLRIEAADAAIALGADILVNALRAGVIGFHDPVRCERVLNAEESADGIGLFCRWVHTADTGSVVHSTTPSICTRR